MFGQGLVAEIANLAGMKGTDRVAGDRPLGDVRQQNPGEGRPRDEHINGNGAVDGVAFPLGEDAVRDIGVIVVGKSEDGFAGEDAVIGPFLEFGQQIRCGITKQVGQGGAAGTRIGFGVIGNGEQGVTGQPVSEDEGKFADHRLRFLVAAGLGNGVPRNRFRSFAPALKALIETAQDGESVFVGGAGKEIVHRCGCLFKILGKAARDELGDGGEFGGEGEIYGIFRVFRNCFGDAIPDHERLLAVGGVFRIPTEERGNLKT